MSHTPGPWTVRTMDVIGHFEVKAEGYEIAEVLGRDIENAQANARLIAAAPELLEACKSFVEASRGRWNNQCDAEIRLREILTIMKTAIQKAEGR